MVALVPGTEVALVAMNIKLQGIRRGQTGIIWVLLAFLYPCGGQAVIGAEPKPLLFLADRDYPPMAFLEEGRAMGMDVDLAKALAREMHREIRIQLMDWGEAQQRLSKGEADGLLGMSITRERRTRFDFASPVFTREFGLLIRKGDETIHGINDLRGKIVGVTQGGFPKEFLESRTGFHLSSISNYLNGFDRLGKGELNAVAGDLWVAAYLLEQKNIHNITIVEKPMARVSAAIALKKGNAELLQEINKALQLLKENGTISRIQSYWKPQEIVFISREKVRNLIALSAGGLALLLLAGMVLWVVTLKKQIRIRKVTEEALKQSEKRLQMLTDASFEGIGLCEDGILADANDQLLKMLGYTRTELIGKPVMDLIAPESRALVRQMTKKRCTDAYEHFAIRKDGSIFPVEVCGRTLATSPKEVRVTAVRDISERKEAEKALLLSEQRFGAVFQQSPVALAVSEFETGRFIEINAALLRLMHGRSFDQMLDRTSLEIGMVTAAERRKIIDSALKFGGGERLEVAMHRLDGEPFVSELSLSFYESNGIRYLLTNIVDITARKRAEEELRASREDLRALAGRLQEVREEERTRIAREIHDILAQELTRLKIDLGWLNRRLSASAQELDRAALSEKVASLTGFADKTIGTVQKIAAELRPVVLDSLGLSAAIEWQAEEFRERTGIVCEAIVPEEDFALPRQSSTSIFRIVQESLTNVIRHAHATRVEIILELEGDILRLLVQDNGIGFNEGKMHDLHSMGLLGMRERALLLGGRFEIRGVPGEGTRVSVTMPYGIESIAFPATS